MRITLEVSDGHGTPVYSGNVRPSMVVLSLKNHLRSHLQLPPGQRLRLFYNSEPLADYDSVKDLMEDAATTRPCHVLRLTLGLAKKRPRPPGHAALDVLVKTPAEGDLADAVAAVRGAIAGGMRPERAFEGSGGTYFLRDHYGSKQLCFKPRDEEANAENNPRAFVGRTGRDPSLREGILSGEAAGREVAASLVDHRHFAGVPATVLARSQHEAYFHADGRVRGKVGSLQMFVQAEGSADDYGPGLFSVEAVQRVAQLDLRILNSDRNGENLLVVRHGRDGERQLCPIDHGYCLPDRLELDYFSLQWRNWRQAKEECCPAVVEYLRGLDVDEDARQLAEVLDIRRPCLLLFRVAGRVVREAALCGFSFSEIAAFMYRAGDGESRSALENLCVVALDVAQHRTGRGRRRPSASRGAPAEQQHGTRGGRRSPDVLSTVGSTHPSDPRFSASTSPDNSNGSDYAPAQQQLHRSSSADAAPVVRPNVAHRAPPSSSVSPPHPATTSVEAAVGDGDGDGDGEHRLPRGSPASLPPDRPDNGNASHWSKRSAPRAMSGKAVEVAAPREVVSLVARNGRQVCSAEHPVAPRSRRPHASGAARNGFSRAPKRGQDCRRREARAGEGTEGEGSEGDLDTLFSGSESAPRDSGGSSPAPTPGAADAGVVAGAYTWRVPAWEAAMECADLDPSRGGVVPSRLDATTTAVTGLVAAGLTRGVAFLWEALRNGAGGAAWASDSVGHRDEGEEREASGEAGEGEDALIDLSAPGGRGPDPPGLPSSSPDDVVSTQTALRDLHSQVRGKNGPLQATARREASRVPRRLVPFAARGPGQTRGLLRVASYDVSSSRLSRRFLSSPDERDLPFQWQAEHDGLEDQFLAAFEVMLPEELARWKRRRTSRRRAL